MKELEKMGSFKPVAFVSRYIASAQTLLKRKGIIISMKRKPKNPAFEELRDMLPTALIINGTVLVIISIYGIFEGITWRAVTGLLYGDILAAGNFILLGASASATVVKATAKKGQFFANMSYGARYIGLFLLLALGIWLNFADILPAFAPLFIPKIHYTFKYALRGKSYDDLS